MNIIIHLCLLIRLNPKHWTFKIVVYVRIKQTKYNVLIALKC